MRIGVIHPVFGIAVVKQRIFPVFILTECRRTAVNILPLKLLRGNSNNLTGLFFFFFRSRNAGNLRLVGVKPETLNQRGKLKLGKQLPQLRTVKSGIFQPVKRQPERDVALYPRKRLRKIRAVLSGDQLSVRRPRDCTGPGISVNAVKRPEL